MIWLIDVEVVEDLRRRRDANRQAAARFRVEGQTGWLATEAAAEQYEAAIKRLEWRV